MVRPILHSIKFVLFYFSSAFSHRHTFSCKSKKKRKKRQMKELKTKTTTHTHTLYMLLWIEAALSLSRSRSRSRTWWAHILLSVFVLYMLIHEFFISWCEAWKFDRFDCICALVLHISMACIVWYACVSVCVCM